MKSKVGSGGRVVIKEFKEGSDRKVLSRLRCLCEKKQLFRLEKNLVLEKATAGSVGLITAGVTVRFVSKRLTRVGWMHLFEGFLKDKKGNWIKAGEFDVANPIVVAIAIVDSDEIVPDEELQKLIPKVEEKVKTWTKESIIEEVQVVR